jgi:hypothetical protein
MENNQNVSQYGSKKLEWKQKRRLETIAGKNGMAG